MIKLVLLFKKKVLLVLVAAFALAVLPLTNVHASGLNNQEDPPPDSTRLADVGLERIWARLQRVYERQGRKLDRADRMVERFQNLIDRMEENGEDVTSLQAALDVFEDSLKKAHPVYESTKGIINSHQGFDAGGKVIDREKAVETVRALGEKLKDIRQIVGEPGRALRDAFKAFREAHQSADSARP